MNEKLKYFVGIGLGFIPVVIYLLGSTSLGTNYNFFTFWFMGAVCYLLEVVLAINFLGSQRYLAYGLFTMIVAGPVIVAIGCLVVLPQLQR